MSWRSPACTEVHACKRAPLSRPALAGRLLCMGGDEISTAPQVDPQRAGAHLATATLPVATISATLRAQYQQSYRASPTAGLRSECCLPPCLRSRIAG